MPRISLPAQRGDLPESLLGLWIGERCILITLSDSFKTWHIPVCILFISFQQWVSHRHLTITWAESTGHQTTIAATTKLLPAATGTPEHHLCNHQLYPQPHIQLCSLLSNLLMIGSLLIDINQFNVMQLSSSLPITTHYHSLPLSFFNQPHHSVCSSLLMLPHNTGAED